MPSTQLLKLARLLEKILGKQDEMLHASEAALVVMRPDAAWWNRDRQKG